MQNCRKEDGLGLYLVYVVQIYISIDVRLYMCLRSLESKCHGRPKNESLFTLLKTISSRDGFLAFYDGVGVQLVKGSCEKTPAISFT